MVDDESRPCAAYFFDMLFFNIVDFYFIAAPVFGIVGGKFSRFLEYPVRQNVPVGLDDNKRTGRAFGMEPPIISGCKMKS